MRHRGNLTGEEYAAMEDGYEQGLAARAKDLGMVCDSYGLPHSAVALAQHLTGNADLTIEVWKETCRMLEERISAAQAELADVSRSDALRTSRAMIVLGPNGVALLAAVDADKAAGAHHD